MKEGFTLVELLLSVAILSLIVMILGGAFQLVTRSWQKGEEEAEDFRKTKIVLDRIAEQIKSIYPYLISKDEKWIIAFQGGPHILQCVSPLSLQSPLISGLVWIRYSLKDERIRGKNFLVQEGMVVGNDFFPESTEEAAKEGITMTLLFDVEDLTFEYFVLSNDAPKGEWRTRWVCEGEGDLMLPQAIRLTLKQKSKSPEKEPLVTAMTVPLITLPDEDLPIRGKLRFILPPPGESSPRAQK